MGKVKGQIIFIALLFIMVDLACWISIDIYYKARAKEILNNWSNMEMIIVKEASRASAEWLHEKISIDKMNPSLVEKEVFTKFIKPIQLLENGDAWIYNRRHIIYDNSDDLPEEYIGRSIRDIFKMQSQNGASHYDSVVRGVEESTEGKDWYVWLPEKGREFSAWTSLKNGLETWTIGLSTPENEILENADFYTNKNIEYLGLTFITILLFILFLFIWFSKLSDFHQNTFLQNTNNYQLELIQEIQEKSTEINQKNIELVKASRAKNEFLANMSHELRTPLNAIIGLSEVLREDPRQNMNPEQNQKLQHIYESGKHLLSLINDILDLAKTESGKIYVDCNKVAVQSLCTACIRFVEPLASKKNIDVSLTIDPEIIYCWGDELRLKQILVNLLGNAIKFTPEKNSIGLIVSKELTQDTILFEVWDTGIGIDPEKMKQIFQPFIQLDSKLSRLYGGSGLGLTLAFRLVELHGGSISLAPKESGGCSFFVRIPINKPSKEVCFIQKCHWKGIVYSENDIFIEQLHELIKDPHAPELVFIKKPFEPENCLLPNDADFILLDVPVITDETIDMVKKIRSLAQKINLPVIFSLSLELPDNAKYLQQLTNASSILHPYPFTFLLKYISTHLLIDNFEEKT
jgi:signal transduction histidine kinase